MGTVGIYIQYIYKTIVVLASEPVGGRSLVTDLPCYFVKMNTLFALYCICTSIYMYMHYKQVNTCCENMNLLFTGAVPSI